MRGALAATLAALLPAMAGAQQQMQGGLSPAGDASQTTVTSTGSTTARTTANRAADVINVLDYGAVGDGVQLSSFVTVALSTPTQFRINAGAFSSADVGKAIFINGAGAGGIEFASTIASVTDATHIVTQDSASTALTAATETVTYGTDDEPALTTLGASLGSSTGAFTVPTTVLFPKRLYIIKAASVNLTNLTNVDVQGYGATIYGATNGLPVFDLLGMYRSQLRGFQFIGDQALPPLSGHQVGRYTPAGRAFGLNHFADLTASGYFSFAPCVDMASETTQFDNYSCSNTSNNAYAGIFDGVNHFSLSSQYVTVTLPANSAYTFTDTVCHNCRFVATGSGSNAVWIAAPKNLVFDNGYTKSSNYNMVIYQTVNIRASNIYFEGTFEGPPLDNVYFAGTGSTAIDGLTINIPTNQATGYFIAANPALTTIKMRNVNLTMDTLPGGSGLFDSTSVYTVNGGSLVILDGASLPALPTVFNAPVVNADAAPNYYGFASPQLPTYGSGLVYSNGVVSAAFPTVISAVSVNASGVLSGISVSASAVWRVPGGGPYFPTATLSGGGGTGGGVTAIAARFNSAGAITSGGTGYVTGDLVNLSGAGGVCSPCQVDTVTASGGVVTALTSNTGGTYTSMPVDTVNLTWTTQTGSGSGLTTHGATYGFFGAGASNDFALTPGTGYTSSPTVTWSYTGNVVYVNSTTTTPLTTSSTLTLGTGSTAETIDSVQHVTLGGATVPTAGTGAASIAANATDQRMRITTGSAVTSISASFGKTWTNTPVCTASQESATPVGLGFSALSTTAFTITALSALTSAVIDVICQ